VVDCRGEQIDSLMDREWLLGNRIGAFASSTIAACNTRRYHGLLIASATPPVDRIMMLSTVMERLETDQGSYELATNEFDEAFAPRGYRYLDEFRYDAMVTFVYRTGGYELTRDILLAETSNAVTIRYTLRGGSGRLVLSPFAAIRDFHHLRRVSDETQMTFFQATESGAVVQDPTNPDHTLHLMGHSGQFKAAPDWWYNFYYRQEQIRSQDAHEDLYCPGNFTYELNDGVSCYFSAALDEPVKFNFDATVQRKTERRVELEDAVGTHADKTMRALARASDVFVVNRSFPNAVSSMSILAGFHWFSDWGRDTFISLPGLLLNTGQFAQARKVFKTFSSHLSNGMIPNRFDDYGGSPHYNSIDASLWFIIAAERYIQTTGDISFWKDTLLSVCDTILRTYREGTSFGIHADADGLLTGGSETTQLTWMDAALGEETITPRYGKAVEINALWYSAHRIMAQRCDGCDKSLGQHYADLADIIAPAFTRVFWNDDYQCLYDCINDEIMDAAIRPNQIFAVSLPHSPLAADQQQAVVDTVTRHLLTPRGLRTLSPKDPSYKPRYEGSPQLRDRAYHQGTVWGWLIGPFIEAYLKVNPESPQAVEQAGEWLEQFDEHLPEAGLGYVSEIFDGDPPHHPRGCIAQAWSMAELLRAKCLVQDRREVS
ncbi:MAG: glycogen debranching protein, partial [bacterium]|nr:glycogen debranching protein [bacterium]